MKKKIALLMVMTTLVLTACGAPAQDADTNQPESSSVVESTEETPSSSEEVQEEESTEPEAKAYVAGTYTDNKFESAYVGYSFTAPEGTVFLSAEELAAENGIDAETVAAGAEALAEAYAQLDNAIEFNASTVNGANIYMQVTQMLSFGISLEEYTQIVLDEITAMEGMVCTIVEEPQVVEFIGKECTKTVVSIEMEGMVIYQQYYMFLEPTYTGTITVTYAEGMEADRDALIAGFAAN